VIGSLGTIGVIRAADARTADIERIDGLDAVLADPETADVPYPAENYLLVGSDTREGIDSGSSDFGVIGGSDSVGGRRSDTIMVLRQEANGGAALVSLPRDLWVEIAGTGNEQRINSAYNEGPERLAATVTQSLGIPIHHYIEVDFNGFKDIVDSIGGVQVCTWTAARDTHSGLALEPGCQTLDGVMALAYARSRYYQELDGDRWVTDPRADLGRIERQQLFLREAVNGVLAKMQSSPFEASDLIRSVAASVRVDADLDALKAADTLRRAAQVGLRTYALPVYPDTVGDAAILRLGGEADTLLAYFRGQAPAPPEFETVPETVPPQA
jgi:LCP family protein required for cell wall assembly